jgi:hypothetical protein
MHAVKMCEQQQQQRQPELVAAGVATVWVAKGVLRQHLYCICDLGISIQAGTCGEDAVVTKQHQQQHQQRC